VADVRAKLALGTPIEVWCQDEMRVGQKNKLTYRWARKGSRPRAIHDQRTQSTYLFGAVCPERGAGAALVLPACNSEAMQLHLDEIATKVTPGAHAIVLLDQAGWHGAKTLKVPSNISLMPLPPRAPELNGQENIWHKAGNPRARRVLIEGAWTYRYPARLSRPLQVRQESLPEVVRAIAWKAQVRLCARYRRLMAAGKRQTLITTAIAREMAAFLWAIGHEVQPCSA